MPDQQTQTQGAPASTADSSSNQASSTAVADSPQTATSIVDKGSTAGKSTSSDEDSGAASDGASQRPGRAERRISELTSKIKDLESKLSSQDQLSDRLKTVDTSGVQLPDYSQMTEITPEQLKKDIISAASQIVDLKMATTANVLESRLSQKDSSAQNERAIQTTLKKYSVLNPQSDDYDADLDHEVTEAYTSALQKDPTYSFATFIKPFTRTLDMLSSTTGQQATTQSRTTRGSSANRSSGSPSRKGGDEFPAAGSLQEQEDWFARRRG